MHQSTMFIIEKAPPGKASNVRFWDSCLLLDFEMVIEDLLK